VQGSVYSYEVRLGKRKTSSSCFFSLHSIEALTEEEKEKLAKIKKKMKKKVSPLSLCGFVFF